MCLPEQGGGGEGWQKQHGVKTSSLGTCIGLKVLRGHHDHKPDGTFIPEHLIGPAADGTHTLDRSDAIVGNEHLMETAGKSQGCSATCTGDLVHPAGARSQQHWCSCVGMTEGWVNEQEDGLA